MMTGPEATVNRLRREFYSHRNGIVADKLRSAGDPHQFIMGCPLAELVEIAKRETPNDAVAAALWADRKHRECRLTAPMLQPVDRLSPDEATAWATDVLTHEEADVLCHRLLRRTAFATELIDRLMANRQTPLARYVAYRLMLNLIVIGKKELRPDERNAITAEMATTQSAPLRQVLASLLDD